MGRSFLYWSNFFCTWLFFFTLGIFFKRTTVNEIIMFIYISYFKRINTLSKSNQGYFYPESSLLMSFQAKSNGQLKHVL